MSNLKRGISKVRISVTAMWNLAPADALVEKFDYVGKVTKKQYKNNLEMDWVNTYSYGVRFELVVTEFFGLSMERCQLLAEVKEKLAEQFNCPESDLEIIQTGIAWTEDELWAVAHEWAKEHTFVIFSVMGLRYWSGKSDIRNPANWSGNIEDAVRFTKEQMETICLPEYEGDKSEWRSVENNFIKEN